jgi:hypothetical protein
MKNLLPAFAAVILPVFAQAQILDAAVAAEALRGAALNSAVNILGKDAESAGNYRELAVEQALAVEAGRYGLDERIDVSRALAAARRNVLIQALREEVERQVPAPEDKAVTEFYEKNKTAFVAPSAYQIAVYEWADGAKVISSDLDKKLAVADVEKAVADSGGKVIVPSSATAFVAENSMIPAIWTGLAAMKDGETRWFDGEKGSKVRVTRRAYRASKALTFEESKGDAARALLMRARAEAWQGYVNAMQQRLGLSAAAAESAAPAAPATGTAKPATTPAATTPAAKPK